MASSNKRNLASYSGIRPSAQRKPSAKKQVKAVLPAFQSEDARTVIYETIMNDPEKKKMVLKFLEENKTLIKDFQESEKSKASNQLDKVKNLHPLSSPTAINREKYLKMQKQRQALAMQATEYENKLNKLALTSAKKPIKNTILRDVIAFVEVRNNKQEDKSAGVIKLLQTLGSNISTRLSTRCTHVIYKDGTYDTFKKARTMKIPLVSILWVDVMDRKGYRVPCEFYPAIGDPKAIQVCDDLCDILNGDKPSTARSTTSTFTQLSGDLDDELMKLTEDYNIIPDSQPDHECKSLINQTRQKVRKKAANTIASNIDSDDSDAASNAPLIAGNYEGKTPEELEASMRLNENLLNTPYVNKVRRTVNRGVFVSSNDKENSPDMENMRPEKNMYKNMVQQKAGLAEPEPYSEESTSVAASSTNAPKRSRRTLLPNEVLGIVDETDSGVSLDKTATSISRSNKKKDNKRKTIVGGVSMDITTVGQDNSSKTNESLAETENINVNNVTKVPRNTLSNMDTSSTSPANINTSKFFLNVTKKITNTPSSQDEPKSEVAFRKENTGSVSKLSLRISDGAGATNSNKNDTAGLSEGMNKNKSSISSTRTSASDDLMSYVTRRITRRMSTHIKLHNDSIAETNAGILHAKNDITKMQSRSSLNSESKRTTGSTSELSLRISEKTSSSSAALELRVSSGSNNEENTSLSGENLSNNENDSSLEFRHSNIDNRNGAVVAKDDGANNKNANQRSPVTKLSEQLLKTVITDLELVENTKEMSFNTASTSYSIIDNSTDKSKSTGSSRSRSGRPSIISNTTTSRKTSNVSKASSKRKLHNPDNALETSKVDDDEERQLRTQTSQTQKNRTATRDELKMRLNKLNIPGQLSEDEEEDETHSNDDDFETGPTQKTQAPTHNPVKKFIVCTRFHTQQTEEFTAIVNELGDFTIELNVSNKTTHLVSRECSRTLNILRAMSRGIWILRSDWLYNSRAAGKWLEEDQYEMMEFSPLVQQLRLQRESFGKSFCHDVFIACGAIYISTACHPSEKALEELIKLCKGTVTASIEDAKIIIGGPPIDLYASQAQLVEGWILDSIFFGRCKSINNKKYFVT